METERYTAVLTGLMRRLETLTSTMTLEMEFLARHAVRTIILERSLSLRGWFRDCSLRMVS